MTRENVLEKCLVSFDSRKLKHISADTLIIGSGVAGLSTAIHAAKRGSVLIITKERINENSTEYAQGGIAARLSPEDSFIRHINDTLNTGQGLCDEEVVSGIIREGPDRVRELINWGANFDKENGVLVFTNEGGHSFPRILRAGGDSTGKEIEETLIRVTNNHPNIKVLEYTYAIDLLVMNNSCNGVLVWRKKEGKIIISAKSVILASGGCGQVYRETTNPEVTTGDGIAIAYRAGAILQDLEFMQFHPTTLYVVGAERFLISETVRGEGGILRNKFGDRFMPKYHPKAELAPRDIVSKSILHEIRKTNYTHVFLDVRHISEEKLSKRFPKIKKLCSSFGIDITRELIPVQPSAHYMIGGVKVDQKGRTNIRNLYACGEVACSGLHGANRLGSNSLLEGLVFGFRIGNEISKGLDGESKEDLSKSVFKNSLQKHWDKDLDLEDVRNSLKSVMWRNIGIERDGKYINEAVEDITHWSKYILHNEFSTPLGWEVQNMLSVTRLICISALKRCESRGVHYRLDFPECDDKEWKKHIIVCNDRYDFVPC